MQCIFQPDCNRTTLLSRRHTLALGISTSSCQLTWQTADWTLKMAWLTGVRRSIHRFSRRVSCCTVENWASSRFRSSSERMASASSKGRPSARDTQRMLRTFSSTCAPSIDNFNESSTFCQQQRGPLHAAHFLFGQGMQYSIG